MSDAFYFLVILIAFADDGNDVSAARQAQRVFDGFFAVRYDHGLFVPAPAVGEDFQLLEVRQDGRDLTASLQPEQLAALETAVREASRFRWKNPVGTYPLDMDTITLLGTDGESVTLVGSQGRFAVDGYPLHDGETLLAEVQNILAS